MGYMFIRIEDKEKLKLAKHAKSMGYGTLSRFVLLAMKELFEKDQRLDWKLYAQKTRRTAGSRGL